MLEGMSEDRGLLHFLDATHSMATHSALEETFVLSENTGSLSVGRRTASLNLPPDKSARRHHMQKRKTCAVIRSVCVPRSFLIF